jgi:hypothetical protein
MAEQANRQQLPKVLRIGIVQKVGDDPKPKVVHERVLKPGQTVTVGESDKNTFVFSAPGLPKRFTLFSTRGEAYTLHFTDGMQGMVSKGEGKPDSLESLRQGDGKKAEGYAVPLDTNARGKLIIGDITVLFQFVTAPPESARTMAHGGGAIPTDFRPKLVEDDDPIFYGFLALFGTLGAVLTIYVANTEPIPQDFLTDIPPQILEIIAPAKDDEVQPEEEVVEEARPDPEKASKVKPEVSDQPEPPAAPRTREEVQQDLTKNSALIAMLIGTQGEGQTGERTNAFSTDDSNFSSLQDAAQNAAGVVAGTDANLAMRNASGPGGRENAGIGGVGTAGGGTAAVGTVAAPKPKGSASLGSVEPSNPEAADKVKTVVRRNQGQIKACYEAQLLNNPSLSGRVAVTMTIVSGRVTSAKVDENTTGDDALGTCITRKIRSWKFDADVSDEGIYLPFSLSPG